MREDQLLAILKDEEKDAASYYDSELASDQEKAMQRFFAKPYGDEAPDRSRVVSHDLEDTVNWIMPDLLRPFISSDELVTIEPNSAQDEEPEQGDPSGRPRTEVVADYLDHIFFKDNDGERNLHDMVQDGLIQRVGFLQVDWKDPEAKPPMKLIGLSVEHLAKYVEDQEYEIKAADETATGWELEVVHKPAMGRVRIEAVPNEEIAFSKLAKSLEQCDYYRRKQHVFVADMMRLYPDKAAELDPEGNLSSTGGSDDDDVATDPRVQARHPNESVDTTASPYAQMGRKKDWLLTEHIRIDFDGDNIVELRQIKRMGNTILENEIVDCGNLVVWTPMRVAHKIAGRSFADVLEDLQKIRTVLTRRMLDGLAQSLTPQKIVNTGMADETTYEDLVDNDVGGFIRVNGEATRAMTVVATPDVSASALQAMEHFDQRIEQATGVTRHSQGIDPTALNKTATGIELLQAAAKVRTELIARWAAAAVKEAYQKTLKLICAHQDRARQVKINDVWADVDPRRWSDEMAVSIHVGTAASSTEQQIVNLLGIAAKQEQIMMQLGPANPLCPLTHYRNTLVAIAQAQGYKNGSRFWGEIPEGWAPEPQKDPAAAALEAKTQILAMEKQHQAQMAEQTMQHKQQLAAAEFQNKQRLQAAELHAKTALKEMEIQAEARIADIRLRVETNIAYREMEVDEQIQHRKADAHVEGSKIKANAAAKAKKSNGNGKAKGSSVRMGGKLG